MLKILKKYLLPEFASQGAESINQEQRLQIAMCVLLLEMANVDDEFSLSEKTMIREILEEEIGIPKENVKEIMGIAQQDRNQTIDLYEYTSFINKNFSLEERKTLIELIWKVVYADGVLDKYEDYLIHKLTQLLHLHNDDLIDAKLKVKAKIRPKS